ncbi:MAG: CGNR zinc finger domain-containing protein [Actinobacteria bacterium]|nr:CGNR zinc finger domain-containing protein [Actinomycetota bacterium]
MFRLLSAVAHQRVPAATDLEMLNSELVEASGHLRLILAPGGGDAEDVGVTGFPARPRFDWEWSGLGDSLTSLLWPVARATAELLSSRQKSQLRECAGDSCEWLFLDLSKNASRRWCDMSACGNRAKAKRYRARKTEGNSAPPAAG